jgi:hypothetical protein
MRNVFRNILEEYVKNLGYLLKGFSVRYRGQDPSAPSFSIFFFQSFTEQI